MSRDNTSSGGYLLPNPQPPELDSTPPNQTLIQFIQNLLVGLSGIPGPLVRPQWQVSPPKQPDLGVNWVAFGIDSNTPDFNAYVGYDPNDNPFLQRNELLQVTISVYGPSSYDNAALIRDGFQLTQNLALLRQAKIGYAYENPAQHLPDFFGERWIDRWRFEVFLRRQVQRTYPILNFLSANGTTYAQTASNANFEQNWETGS